MVQVNYKPKTLVGALFLCLKSKNPLNVGNLPNSEFEPFPTMLGGLETSITLQDYGGDYERLLVFDTRFPAREKRETLLFSVQCQKGKEKGQCGLPVFKHRKDLVTFNENGLLKDFLPAVSAVQNELSNLIKLGHYEIVKIEPVKKVPEKKEKEPAEGNVF